MAFTPKKASREDLIGHLTSLGFKRTSHLWNWPKGSRNFHWFETEGFVSYVGVEATVYPESSGEKEPVAWSLHTRTRSSASAGDREQQNHTIRTARKAFGGTFTNDSEGKNRYTTIHEDRRDATARGIYLSYELVSQELSESKQSLPAPHAQLEGLVGTDLEALSHADPTRVLYNALFPFAVAAIEHFFSQSFKVMLKHEPKAQNKLINQTKKVDISVALDIRDGTTTIEDVVANWYSFQNIDGIHRAFKEWFEIDLYGILRKRKKVGAKLPMLEKRLLKLIQFRHGIVHRFETDRSLRKDDLVETTDLVQVILDTFVQALENSRGIPIRNNT